MPLDSFRLRKAVRGLERPHIGVRGGDGPRQLTALGWGIVACDGPVRVLRAEGGEFGPRPPGAVEENSGEQTSAG